MVLRSLKSAAPLAVVCTLLLAAPSTSYAQDLSPEKVAEARDHYERGISLYDAKDYDAARAEFERAYAIAPSYRILYNIALVQRRKSDYVGALRNFELYLSEGGAGIPEVRKKQVEQELAELHDLVATVNVTTNVPGAEILVDDAPVGKSPLKEPLLVNPGRRKIGAAMKGKLPAAKVIEVVGKDRASVSLELQNQVVVLDKPSRRVPWVGWGATVVLAGVAGVTGYVALNASNELSDRRDQPNANADDLDKYASRTRTFGIVSDVATVGAVIAGGISLFYTLKWNAEYNRDVERWEHDAKPTAKPKVFWGPTGVAGTF